MEEFGKVFKIIRESKNMSLKEVAGECVTPAQLSRFENGKSNLTVDTFFRCLNNMDVLQGEFFTLYSMYYQVEDIRLSQELYKALDSGNISYLRNKIMEYEEKYVTTNRKSDRLLISVFHVFIYDCDSSYVIPEKEKANIVDYLLSIDEWCLYELWILGNCVRSLSTKTLSILGMELIKRTQFYNNIEENRRRVYRVLLNITGELLERREEKDAIKFIRTLDNLEILEKDLIERLQLKFCKAHLRYLQGFEDAIDIMNECKRTMDFLECYNISRQIEQTISQLTDM